MNKYILKVEDHNVRGHDGVDYYAVETYGTLEEVVEIFKKADKEWENDENPGDWMDDYIGKAMKENGINFYQLVPDKTIVI